MTSRELRTLIERWERGIGPSDEEIRRILLLREDDLPLYERIAPLLPLMLRDAGVPIELPVQVPGIAERVLESLSETPGTVRPPKRAARPAAPRWLLQAAAAAVLLGFGILIGLTVANRPTQGPDMVVVRFELADPQAKSVAVVGDFNDWKPQSLVMHKVRGVWEISVPLRRGDVYTYNFLIDGRSWIPDPASLYRVRDGFGGEKSVLQL